MKKLLIIIILLFCIFHLHNEQKFIKNYIIHFDNSFNEFIVTATIYKTGKTTASLKEIISQNYGSYKFIAISRDLLKFFNFGDKVLLTGTGIYDGIYFVEDLMNKRWNNKIDILVDKNEPINMFYNIKIKKL